MNSSEPILKVEHISQYFNKNKFRAVDDISFDLYKGEVFGLVGESGCGKTTTGRSIINLYKLTKGRIYFKGKLTNIGEEESKESKELRKLRKNPGFNTKIQMIFQDPVSSLDPRMTVRELVAEGLRIQGEKNEQVITKKVDEALVKVGLLPEYGDRYPHEFSGGQKQRIGIARALIMNPELIIADEPVSALDVSIKAQVINLLNDLRKELGLTVLFVAHDLSVVKYFSDRIAVMYKGKIVEIASSDELFSNPVHPYTKALLSAIPFADPETEKKRQRLIYNPEEAHDYSKELPEFTEIFPGHYVMCNSAEKEKYLKEKN